MSSFPVNVDNMFMVDVPLNWSRQSSPDNHLLLGKLNGEVIVIKREAAHIFRGAELDEYLFLLRGNAGRMQQYNDLDMSSVEPFSTPYYNGKIMTYAFYFNGIASEITLFAFRTEAYFYILMMQSPVGGPMETLNEYFDIVNSFRIIDENAEPPQKAVGDMKFVTAYDDLREFYIIAPDNWDSIIEYYCTDTDYSIFISSGDRNQVAGVCKLVNFRKSDGYRLAETTRAVREAFFGSVSVGEYTLLEINGMKAMQCEEEYTPKSLTLKYLNTVVEAEEFFYLISCWTPPGFYARHAELFRYMTNSFALCKCLFV